MNPDEQSGPIQVDRVQGGFHVVIDGYLNPMILLPSWFEREGLLRAEEVAIANEQLKAVPPAFVAFNAGGLSFVASQQSLEVFSNNEGHVLVIRDLIESVFTLLSHTPLEKLTISRSGHFSATNLSGQNVVQPSWDPVMNQSAFTPVLEGPSLSDLAARGPGILPLPESSTTVSVQPSENSDASLFVECQYSGSLEAGDGRSGAVVLTEMLKECIEKADRHSQVVFEHFGKLLFRAGR